MSRAMAYRRHDRVRSARSRSHSRREADAASATASPPIARPRRASRSRRDRAARKLWPQRASATAAVWRSIMIGFPADTERPAVEIVDVIADMAAVAPEARAGASAAMFLARAHRNPEIMGGLLGAEEGRAAQRAARAASLIVVVHGPIRMHRAAPRDGWIGG